MRCLIVFLLILGFSVQIAHAQTPVTRPPALHLEPIGQAPGSSILGTVFLYKGRKLNSPFSVEIPIQELNDPVANRHFRRFRTWTTVGRLTGLASIAYVLFNRTPDRQTSRAVYVGSLVASIGFSLLSNHQVNLAVRRYNTVLGRTRVGLMVIPALENKQLAIGLGMGISIGFDSYDRP